MPVALATLVPPAVESTGAVYVQDSESPAWIVNPDDAPLPQSTTAPGSESLTLTSVTLPGFGFPTVIVPDTLAFRAKEPVFVTTTLQVTLPEPPASSESDDGSTDFSTDHVLTRSHVVVAVLLTSRLAGCAILSSRPEADPATTSSAIAAAARTIGARTLLLGLFMAHILLFPSFAEPAPANRKTRPALLARSYPHKG
jgi:hypothetical protein